MVFELMEPAEKASSVKQCSACGEVREGCLYEYGYGYGHGNSVLFLAEMDNARVLGLNKAFICNECAASISAPYGEKAKRMGTIILLIFIGAFISFMFILLFPHAFDRAMYFLFNTYVHAGDSHQRDKNTYTIVVCFWGMIIFGCLYFISKLTPWDDYLRREKNLIEIYAFKLNKHNHIKELKARGVLNLPGDKKNVNFRGFTTEDIEYWNLLESLEPQAGEAPHASEVPPYIETSIQTPTSFKYCRVYSWPYNNKRDSLTKDIYHNAKAAAKNLDIQCDFVIFTAYEIKEFPFFAIAIDSDYFDVADSEISKKIDRFIDQLGGEEPQALENPGWFQYVNEDYEKVLAGYGVTVMDGYYIELDAGENKEMHDENSVQKIMNKYGIIYSNEKYVYKEYSYDKLDDAINYAQKQNLTR